MRTIGEALSGIAREVTECLGKVSTESTEQALLSISAARRLFLAGAGRSSLGVSAFAMRLMQMGKDVHLVGETTTPAITPGDLLIIGSGSGATGSLVAMSAKAKKIGAHILIVTVDRNSPIGNLAEVVVVIPAPSPKAEKGHSLSQSIQPMGSLFEQSLFLFFDALVLILMEREKVTSDVMFTRHANLE